MSKYIILIGDGMGDEPIESLGGKTPLEVASTPNMDSIADVGELGMFNSVPEGFPPGSDVANMSILGYAPQDYYSGRAPLEAANIGVELGADDVAFRCNLVTISPISGADGTRIMADYSAGHITTEEAFDIVKTLDKELSKEGVRFYPGKVYRHLMVWAGGEAGAVTTPPHDISDKPIEGHLPKGEGADKLNDLMRLSEEILRDHPVNVKRRAEGLPTADSIWLWGQGRAPKMPTVKELYGIEGSIISAVDLMNGLGIYAGLDVIDVPGITGYIDTDYTAKATYALKSLEAKDFVCVHVEAPDEAGHQGRLDHKLKAIEDFDELVVGRVMKEARKHDDWNVVVLYDHPTPVELKTHTLDKVAYAIYKGEKVSKGRGYSEVAARATGTVIDKASGLMTKLIGE